MADRKYEIDAEGNLVQSGDNPAANDPAANDPAANDRTVSAAKDRGSAAAKDGAATATKNNEETADQPVTAADRRRFLNALIASDVVGVLVLGGSGLLLPESRTLLLILAVLYAVAGVAVYIWMSRTTQRKVEESRERQANG